MFNLFSSIQISHSKIGDIVLDAITSEQTTSNLDISDSPIESGAVITDHVALQPVEITITGVVVEQEPILLSSLAGLNPLRSGLDFVNSLASVSSAQDILAMPKNLVDAVKTTAQDAKKTVQSIRGKTPFLPDFNILEKIDSTGVQSRPRRVIDELLKLQQQGEPVSITTRLKTYENMLLSSVSVTEDPSGKIEVSITAREIIIVETQTKKNEDKKTAGKIKGGRAKEQAQPVQKQGETKPPEAPKEKSESMLRGLF